MTTDLMSTTDAPLSDLERAARLCDDEVRRANENIKVVGLVASSWHRDMAESFRVLAKRIRDLADVEPPCPKCGIDRPGARCKGPDCARGPKREHFLVAPIVDGMVHRHFESGPFTYNGDLETITQVVEERAKDNPGIEWTVYRPAAVVVGVETRSVTVERRQP